MDSSPHPLRSSLTAAPTQPAKKRNIYVVGSICSIGGLLFGNDTGSIGPITTMPSFKEYFPQVNDRAALGAIVATILISACVTSFAGGYLSDRYSRKRTIAAGALVFCFGAALQAGSVNLTMFVLGRLLAGAGEGLFLAAIGVYLVEISPPDVRGRVTSILQLLITIGLSAGYFICYGTSSLQYTSLSWRIPFILQSIVALALAITLFQPRSFVPFSPRWLFQQHRYEEAFAVMDSFGRGSSSEVEKEELLAQAQSGRGKETATVVESFRDPETRWRTIFGMFLYGMLQLSGIDGVLYYAPLIFAQAGLASRQASFLASGVSGLLIVITTIPAQYWLMDRWGRRSCTISGGLVMMTCMLVLGSLYASGAGGGPYGKWIGVSFIYLFIIAFSLTWAVVLKLFITEIQPTRTRATASSLAHSANWLVNLSVALTTPIFLERSPSGPYFLWGGCLLITSLVCMLCMPETLGKSLQEIDTVWDERSARVKSYMTLDAVRGLRRRGGEELELDEFGTRRVLVI